MIMKTGTFEMLNGYENEYNAMLQNELERLVALKKGTGITHLEDNMIFQLKTHLGIDTNLLSQKKAAVADKDIGIESYN
jgi:hypothetical protein